MSDFTKERLAEIEMALVPREPMWFYGIPIAEIHEAFRHLHTALTKSQTECAKSEAAALAALRYIRRSHIHSSPGNQYADINEAERILTESPSDALDRCKREWIEGVREAKAALLSVEWLSEFEAVRKAIALIDHQISGLEGGKATPQNNAPSQ